MCVILYSQCCSTANAVIASVQSWFEQVFKTSKYHICFLLWSLKVKRTVKTLLVCCRWI